MYLSIPMFFSNCLAVLFICSTFAKQKTETCYDSAYRKGTQKGLPFINYPHLHRQVWAKEYFKAQAKHEETKFKGDYTQVPRGRVAWNIDKFIVLVGHWAEPLLDELTALVEEEFSLPYFEFVYDEHWDIGHGWSGDM